jgi:hypothetical protein
MGSGKVSRGGLKRGRQEEILIMIFMIKKIGKGRGWFRAEG